MYGLCDISLSEPSVQPDLAQKLGQDAISWRVSASSHTIKVLSSCQISENPIYHRIMKRGVGGAALVCALAVSLGASGGTTAAKKSFGVPPDATQPAGSTAKGHLI